MKKEQQQEMRKSDHLKLRWHVHVNSCQFEIVINVIITVIIIIFFIFYFSIFLNYTPGSTDPRG